MSISSLPRPEGLLELVDGSPDSQFAGDSQQIVPTILEELSPPGSPAPLSDQLSSLGYAGNLNDSDAINRFLYASLQAKRILARREASYRVEATNASADYRLSLNVSRLFHALDTPPADVHLAGLIDQITRLVSKRMTNTNTITNFDVSSPLQHRILSESDSAKIVAPARLAVLTRLVARLQREQATRVGLLLTRLQVTTQSFARAQKAREDKHSALAFCAAAQRSRNLQAQWATPYPLTVLQTLAARKYLLADGQLRTLLPDRASSVAVKDFVMGSVPDRGGRIFTGPGSGSGSAADMPQFLDRVGTAPQHKKRQGSGNARRGRKGRWRR